MDGKQGLEGAPKRSYAHIVIGEDDADEVIQAGIVDNPSTQAVPEQPQAEEQPSSADLRDDEHEEPKLQPGRDVLTSNDGYRETTLEDLKGSPMPFAQKAVLVVAALLVLAAVAYWFLH